MRKDRFCLIVPGIIISIIFSIVIANATTYIISGIVFDDKNCNSQRNAGDGGIGGVTITISPGDITTTTLSDGTYSLSGLEEGIYTVMEAVPTGYCNTTPNSRTIKIKNKSITNQNFGNSKLISNVPCEKCSSIQIQYPSNGATVDKPETMIKGIIKTSGSEVGVVINGVVAQVVGDEFVANHLPLTQGWNTITAEVTGVDGSKTSTSIQVYGQPKTEYINLTSDKESGISPLDITLMVDTYLTNPVLITSTDYSGPSTLDITTISPTEYKVTMTTEGTYIFTIAFTDTKWNVYEDSVIVNVLSKDKIDTLLKGKWTSMITAFNRGDVNAALANIVSDSQALYKTLFNILGGQIPSIMATAKEFNLINITDKVAKYELLTSEEGKTYSYEVIFIRDTNGLWKIKEF